MGAIHAGKNTSWFNLWVHFMGSIHVGEVASAEGGRVCVFEEQGFHLRKVGGWRAGWAGGRAAGRGPGCPD